ncbi:MAG: SDR family oxidoreductase [Acidobacteriia bacterium]|nr:SDR family oxidoreductase [Terriglobia bacterium]
MMLNDKVAVITGGGSGIGRGIARVFSKHRAHSIILDANAEAAEAVAQEITGEGGCARAVVVDVSCAAQVNRTFEEIQKHTEKLDILVNCAGIYVHKDAVTLEEADWDRCLDVNLKGAWLCSKQAIPRMVANGGGSIINIGSTHAERAQGKAFPYGVSKGGLISLTRSLAVDFGRDGVRVNLICPGFVLTPLTLELFSGPRAAALEELIAMEPMPVRIYPEDIANAALFLASDMARCITGTTLYVDGGRTISAGIDHAE